MFTKEEIEKFETLKEAFYYINESKSAKKELHQNLQKCANNFLNLYNEFVLIIPNSQKINEDEFEELVDENPKQEKISKLVKNFDESLQEIITATLEALPEEYNQNNKWVKEDYLKFLFEGIRNFWQEMTINFPVETGTKEFTADISKLLKNKYLSEQFKVILNEWDKSILTEIENTTEFCVLNANEIPSEEQPNLSGQTPKELSCELF